MIKEEEDCLRDVELFIEKLDLECWRGGNMWFSLSFFDEYFPEWFIEKYKYRFERERFTGSQVSNKDKSHKPCPFTPWGDFWGTISLTSDLPEWFIEKYQNKIDWDIISDFRFMSDEFIEKYKNNMVEEVLEGVIKTDGVKYPQIGLIYNKNLKLMPKAQEIIARRATIEECEAKQYLSPEYYQMYLNYKACKDLIE